jgi:hypothetical protein
MSGYQLFALAVAPFGADGGQVCGCLRLCRLLWP